MKNLSLSNFNINLSRLSFENFKKHWEEEKYDKVTGKSSEQAYKFFSSEAAKKEAAKKEAAKK